MTYQQAYDKIIQAYFRDEIQPYSGEFCFCGTLAGFDLYSNDTNFKGWPTSEYSSHNLDRMEKALLLEIFIGVGGDGNIYCPFKKDITDVRKTTKEHPNYETALFNGMTRALSVLKQIHRERGEDVDSLPALTKRNLQTV